MNDVSQLNAALAGRYQVDREVGQGGMATVYLARDLRHDRRVALKVLKPELGAVLGVERFLAEIKVTANLQHPNLLPLFDSGAADGLLFYVMPFVEGESLRARLDREKHLPVDEAVGIAAAVASALDYAHRQGVIHRDLKPENILLHEGQPLVADFGIALAVSNAGGGRITQTGLSLGTPQYMSPEQATGDRTVDGRTDIYSLGAVTYEMLAGEPPHTGSTSQAIIARVLTEKPRSVRASRPNVPAFVEAAVEHALEKLPADRFATAREFADVLTGKVVVALTGATAVAAGARGRPTSRERALVVALGVVAVLWVVTAIVAARRPPPGADQPDVRFEIATPPSGGPLQVGISPDGRTVVFAAISREGRTALWSRPLNSTEAGPISGTEGANNNAFWSPDSREIGFVSDGKLKRTKLAGGAPMTICAVPNGAGGGSWNSGNVIIFAANGSVYRVPASGGLPVKVELSSGGGRQWTNPRFLPDGTHFLALVRTGSDTTRGVYVASIAGGTPIRVTASDTRVELAPPDQLLFVRDDALYAQTLDMRRFQLTGEPVRIVDDVGTNLNNGSAGFGVSTTGALVKRRALQTGMAQLHWYARSGAQLAAVGDSADIREFALSPDGKRVGMTRRLNDGRIVNVWIVDVASNIASPLTARAEGVDGVLWSGDSRSVTYRSLSGADTIFAKPVGGSRDSLLLAQGERRTYAEDYSHDGKTLLLRRPVSAGNTELLSLALGGHGAPASLGTLKTIDEVRLSPDDKSISYGSNESGVWQVWVASYPSLENRRQVSANGGVQARWRGDGKELLFLSLDGNVMVAAVTPGPTPAFRTPTLLFQSPLRRPRPFIDQFDVTKDGQRFLFAVSPDRASADVAPIMVVLNWTNALKKK